MMAQGGITSVEMLYGQHRSPLASASDRAWSALVDVLSTDVDGKPRKFDAHTSAGLGCFAIRARRLQEIGVLKETVVRDGKTIASPTDKRVVKFLTNIKAPKIQYNALVVSLCRYASEIAKTTLPATVTLSGALALHHRLGPKALEKWGEHQEPSTVALFRRANGLF